MATSKMRKSLEFVGGETVKGLPTASASDQAVPKSQLDSVAATKQNNISAGSGITIDGVTVGVNLATSGTDYGSLTLSGTNYASLNGVYTLAAYKGSLSYAGLDLDLDVGGNFNFYYKDNGSGVWAVIGKRDTDNIYNNGSIGEGGEWIAVLTLVDPTSISEDYNSFIPNYQAVDYDFITFSSEQDDNGNGTVSSSSSQVTYAAGSTPAGLIFDNSKLALDFAQAVGDAASTKVFPSSVIKTYLDEQVALAKISGNNSFSNAVAQIAGNPSNVQTLGEALKNAIDGVSSTVSSNQATASSEYSNIDNLQAAVGSSTGNMGTTHATLTNDTTVKALIDELAVLVATARSDADTTFGVSVGQLIGAIGETVNNGSDVVAALTSIVQKLETVEGDLTNRLDAVEFYHNLAEFPLTANQLAGTEAFDTVQTGLGTGESTDVAAYVAGLTTPRDVKILMSAGTTGAVEAGIYTRNKDTGFLTRSTNFDESSEIQKGDVIQVLLGGSTAFSDFKVDNASDPVIGTDLIKFELARASGVGDRQVTKAKIETAFLAEFEDLPRQVGPTSVTVPANGSVTIAHGLIKESPYTIYDTAGNDVADALEVDATVAGQLVVTSGDDVDVDVVVTVVGKRV